MEVKDQSAGWGVAILLLLTVTEEAINKDLHYFTQRNGQKENDGNMIVIYYIEFCYQPRASSQLSGT